MLLCIRFAVIALLISALANIPPLGAFAAIAVTLFMSVSPFDRSGNAPGNVEIGGAALLALSR